MLNFGVITYFRSGIAAEINICAFADRNCFVVVEKE